MKSDYLELQQTLKDFLISWSKLKELGVLNTKKDFTSQIGEFLVANIYNAKLAKSTIQKDWDMIFPDGSKVQVKSHAKASTNSNKWTEVQYDSNAEIDIFVIVVFTEDYKISRFYKVPFLELWKQSTQDKSRRLVRWNHLQQYEIETKDLPNQKLINLFNNEK